MLLFRFIPEKQGYRYLFSYLSLFVSVMHFHMHLVI